MSGKFLLLNVICICAGFLCLSPQAPAESSLSGGMYLTSPGDWTDTDGDGMTDNWENRYYWRKADPNSEPMRSQVPSADLDGDGDGVLNGDEYGHMTNPTDPNDYFKLLGITNDGSGNVVVSWHSVSGQNHYVYRSTEVGPAATWQLVYGPVQGNGLDMEYSEAMGEGPVFFKVSLEPREPDYWPNEHSCANSDNWLMENHNRIVVMYPKVLVLNFMNDWTQAESKTSDLISAMVMASRYQYFKNPDAYAFLRYKLAKHVDLRDPSGINPNENSTKYPWTTHFNYERLYEPDFAEWYGYEDPENPGSYLDIYELVNRGLVNELWFFAYHMDYGAPYETIELKQYYDENIDKKVGDMWTGYGPAGNGHDYDMPWIDRSFRITFINGQRGIGCATENFGHAAEGMANYNFCPYYKEYFDDFAGFNLNTKYGLPFSKFYSYSYTSGNDYNVYPTTTTLESHYRGSTYTVNDYIPTGGNVHFTPNGRWHYDLSSPYTVQSTIEHAFMRDGPGGKDLAEDFTISKFTAYNSVAPDCMGPWLIFWRQAMPGEGNTCTDKNGLPMLNWWVFLFY